MAALLLLSALLIRQSGPGGIADEDLTSSKDVQAADSAEAERLGTEESQVAGNDGSEPDRPIGNEDSHEEEASDFNETSLEDNKTGAVIEEPEKTPDPPTPVEDEISEADPEIIVFRQKPTKGSAVPRSSSVTEIDRRLEKAGAKQGHVTFSLIWYNRNDLDLHCRYSGPDGKEHIWFSRKKGRHGELDVDMNANPTTREPVENLYYAKPPKGIY